MASRKLENDFVKDDDQNSNIDTSQIDNQGAPSQDNSSDNETNIEAPSTPPQNVAANDATNNTEQQASTSPSAPDNSVLANQATGAFAQNQASQQPQVNHDPNAWMASYKTPTAQEYNDDDMKFMQDLATRQIKPETYQSLFGKKDTLGKIGSIFGLMLAGAGSGLSHQPNMLMEMMNKEIERDLQAQQQNRTNTQNFLNLSYNHELQKAQQANMYAQANDLNTKNAGLGAVNRALNGKILASLQYMKDINGNNSQGQQIINQQIEPAVIQRVQQNNDKAAGVQALNTAAYMKQNAQIAPAPKFDNGVDYDKMRNQIFLGKNRPEAPDAIPPQDVPAIQSEAKDVGTNRAIMHIWNDSFNELNNSLTANKFNPQKRAALIDAVATRISKDTGAMSTDQASKILDGMFPTASDRAFPGNIAAKYQKGVDHFAGMEAATPALDRYGLKTPFPQMQMPGKKQATPANNQGSSAPIRRTTQDGRTALFDPQTKQFMGYEGQETAGQ